VTFIDRKYGGLRTRKMEVISGLFSGLEEEK